jgi:serine protease inhibitor
MSPLNISTALTICYFGAKNETAKQIKEALDLSHLTDEEILKINEEYDKKIKGGIDREFVNPNKSTIKLANKLYTKEGIDINKDFLDLVSQKFQSEVESVDYSRPNEAAEKVNRWISQQTHDKIKSVVTKDSFNDSNRMLLVNTVYFFAEWFDRFNEEETVKKTFMTLMVKYRKLT